ncbi:AAA family ATPase [Janibacter cremeus]|uniref:UvrD-helicase domain-containing protein n=1 Tax=Janibacter cremeus TaxID=1285192 RepID=UPI0023F76F67|nr:UvrD-helicase domain-containing protein [Janibacter cremeus]WEV78612.1 AAA family ATPase [Janibacter cremeus]
MITSTLDAAQELAVAADPTQATVITAGPGSGKSHVVGELSRQLVVDHGLWPDEILVVSFSRAAVQVVNDRTSDIVDEGSSVSTATIDSLAARVIREQGHEEPVLTSFDNTVMAAKDILAHGAEGGYPFEFQHVIIDEVQDVVGVRAEFVCELLKAAVAGGAGFTLLGDPLQSLYDFQMEGRHNWTCTDFLDRVDELFSPTHIHLTGDYRSITPDARQISSLRSDLIALNDDERLRRLRSAVANLAPLGPLDDDALETIAGWPGTTALLCDNNARAGLVADQLGRAGIPSRLATAAEKTPLPAWIAQCLGDVPTRSIPRDVFLDRARSVGVEEPEAAWRELITIADSDRVLDIPTLAGRLTRRSITTFPPNATAPLVVSTVHRAKGLEFDNVVLIDPDDWWRPDEDQSRIARMLYVALSRAHTRVSYTRDYAPHGWFKARVGSGETMWVHGPRGRRGGINGLLMEPSLARALGASATLSNAVIGETVAWEDGDDIEDVDGDLLPSWVATVSGTPVARSGDVFGRFMATKSRRTRPLLRGGHVEGLETVVGPASSTPGGKHGLWLGARISGVIDLKWR